MFISKTLTHAYRKSLILHVEAIKLQDQALLELHETHVAKIFYNCKLVHVAPYLTVHALYNIVFCIIMPC